MMIMGIVVEDQRDANVYSALIHSIRPDVEVVLSRPCRGVAGVRRQFVGWVKNFEWHVGYQVGKAMVIRDSDCRDPKAAEDELARIFNQSGFRPSFPVHFYATRCEMETWLLADEGAVNRVAKDRQKTSSAQPVVGSLEGIPDAKERFRRMLSQANLPADPAVYAEVAAAANIDLIKQRCPYFQQFIERVRAC
jgi:uncharacterized protein DUF4276